MADYTKEEQIAAYGITDEAMRAHFKVGTTIHDVSKTSYSVRRANNTNCPWPSDVALVRFCDAGNLLGPDNSFGGNVANFGHYCIVEVFID